VSDWHHVHPIAPGVHLLQEPGQVNSYLVQGQTYAALIDTGTGIGSLQATVAELTSLPVVVLNTHGHWDHIGGNHQFEQIGIHATEADRLEQVTVPDSARQFLERLVAWGQALPAGIDLGAFRPRPARASFLLEQGQVVDLGGRRLEVWHTPGHSPGSLCFVDESSRLLFTGDTIYEGAIYLHLPGSDVQVMRRSLDLLAQMAWDVDLVMPGHGASPTDGRLIHEVADGLRQAFAGEAPMKRGFSTHGAVRIAAFERFMLFFPPDWAPA